MLFRSVRQGRDWIERHPRLAQELRRLYIYRPGLGVVTVVVGLVQYARGLIAGQREASKLLGVRFIYQFGINAAVPFLTLFLRDEIGTAGWPEMSVGVPTELTVHCRPLRVSKRKSSGGTAWPSGSASICATRATIAACWSGTT